MQNKISELESEQVRRSHTKSILDSEIKIIDSELNQSMEENENPFEVAVEDKDIGIKEKDFKLIIDKSKESIR